MQGRRFGLRCVEFKFRDVHGRARIILRAIVVVVRFWRFCPRRFGGVTWAVDEAQPLVRDLVLPDGDNRLMVQVRRHDFYISHGSSEPRDCLHQFRIVNVDPSGSARKILARMLVRSVHTVCGWMLPQPRRASVPALEG